MWTSPGELPVTSTAATSMTREQLVQQKYNSVRLTFPLKSVQNRRLLTLNSRPVIFDCSLRSWEGRGRLSRRPSADDVELLCPPPTLTLAAFVVCRQPQDHVPLLPTKRCHYTLPLLTPSCRDSEAQSTRRRRHRVVDVPAPTTCRRLRHLTDDVDLTPCRANRRPIRARLLLTAGWLAAGYAAFHKLAKIICCIFCCSSFPLDDT